MRFYFWSRIKNFFSRSSLLAQRRWLFSTWRPWQACLLLIAVIAIIYGQTLFFDYTYLDDQQLILGNAGVLDRANLGEIFFNDVFFSSSKVYYRPLLTWSFVLDWHWGNGSIFAFHLSNIVFHCLAVCLLFYLLRLIKIKDSSALWLSLFFAVHPTLVQAVAWIPGRNDSLAAIFIFSALIFLSRWFRQERLRDLIGLWLLFFAALLTKETAVLLPFLALAWVLIFERPYFSWFKLGLSAAGAAVFGFIWYLLRIAALGHASDGVLGQSLLNNLLSPLIFLGKVFLPLNLSVYPVPADSPWFYGAIAGLLLIALIIVARPRRLTRLFFGLTWFWLILVLGSARPDGDLFRNFMEHRLYVPMFGLLLVLAELEKYFLSWPRRRCQYLLTAVIVIFALLAGRHAGNFSDRLSFWRQAVASSPHAPLAQRNLGAMYYLDGQADQAEILFRQALALNEQEPMAHNNLAAIYIDRGDWWRAEAELKKELEINPNYDLALYNLGRVYYERRRYQEAAFFWQETLRVNPRHQEAYLKLREAWQKIEDEK